MDRHGRNFASAGGECNCGTGFGIVFFVDCNCGLRTGSCHYFGDGAAEGGFWHFCGDLNGRRLPHRQSARLPGWGEAGDSPFAGPIKHRYLVTMPTIIHATVATTTLPANTSG